MDRLKAKRRGVDYRVLRDTLVIDLAKRYRILSSAPRGGGIVVACSILNHRVPANAAMPGRSGAGNWSNPARYLGRLARSVRAAMPVVGLMTAVPMKQLVVDREQSGPLLVECFCTVGVTNAVRAGEPVQFTFESTRALDRHRAGTINIILVTNATLTVSALVGAVQVATESKTATLIKNRVPSAYARGALATGTGTDAVVLASSLEGHDRLQYSGTHTEMGAMIGRLVARCVERGLRRYARWHKTR